MPEVTITILSEKQELIEYLVPSVNVAYDLLITIIEENSLHETIFMLIPIGTERKERKSVLFNDASGAHFLSYHRLLDVKSL